LRSEPYRNTEVKVAVNQVKLDPTAIGEEREKAGFWPSTRGWALAAILLPSEDGTGETVDV
jgi:hypothetical protein